jgi:hypothetical protein
MNPLRNVLDRLKPRARAGTQLLAAALLWTIVGCALGAVGVVWCLSAPSFWPFVLLVAAAALGLAKGRWFIEPVARRNVARLVERGDGRCLGGFLSWKTWLFVASMMALGMALRRSPLPRPLLGLIYAAIGVALLTGSLPLWRARLAGRADPPQRA